MNIPAYVYNIVWPILYIGLAFFIISVQRDKYIYRKSRLIILFWLGITLNLSWVITYFQYNKFIASVIILTFLVLTSILTLSFIPFRKDAIMKVNFFIYLFYSGWLIFAMTLLISKQSTPTVSPTEQPTVSTTKSSNNSTSFVQAMAGPAQVSTIGTETEAPTTKSPQLTEAPTVLNPTPEVTPQRTEAPVITQKILHWVDSCKQCIDEGLDLNFCQKADEDEINANEFDGYTHGENLSQWGCDKVDYPNTPIIRFGDNPSVYVVENVYN